VARPPLKRKSNSNTTTDAYKASVVAVQSPVKSSALGSATPPSATRSVNAGKVFNVIISLKKFYGRRPTQGQAKKQLEGIAKDAVAKTAGWSVSVNVPLPKEEYKGGEGVNWVATGKIIASYTVGEFDRNESVFIRAQRIIGFALHASQSSGRDWVVLEATGPGEQIFNLESCRNADKLLTKVETAYYQLPDEWEPYFLDDIFGLDAQIRITWDALWSCIRSSYRKRSHVCFHGKPACGKTTVCERLYEIIHPISPKGAVARFTASQTTKAGLEEALINADPKPSLIIIEEIDKADPANMSCLIDLCNTEGSLKKTNAFKNVDIPMHALVVCSVNNVPKFKSFHSGALASRFSHKVFFPRPGRKVLELIARRDIAKFGLADGKVSDLWVKKVLDIMLHEQTDDPRRLSAILDAGPRLLDGSFEKDAKEMADALQKESEEMIEREKKIASIHASMNLEDL
jgi:hypothetical protein